MWSTARQCCLVLLLLLTGVFSGRWHSNPCIMVFKEGTKTFKVFPNGYVDIVFTVRGDCSSSTIEATTVTEKLQLTPVVCQWVGCPHSNVDGKCVCTGREYTLRIAAEAGMPSIQKITITARGNSSIAETVTIILDSHPVAPATGAKLADREGRMHSQWP
ncbi:uncharacterized protein LOC143288070 isoform X2 [Babylonia areolata]|uniref:uncharacterized protein LOC143288070 isoform X2 n=1 Tax=Babylonia areolata TaxID=304850 RepID=UPI003FD1A877